MKPITLFIALLIVLSNAQIIEGKAIAEDYLSNEPYTIRLELSDETISLKETIELTAIVTDKNGNPVQDYPVIFSALFVPGIFTSPASNIAGSNAKTDPDGIARVKWYATGAGRGFLRVEITTDGQKKYGLSGITVTDLSGEAETTYSERVMIAQYEPSTSETVSGSSGGGASDSGQTDSPTDQVIRYAQDTKMIAPLVLHTVRVDPSWQSITDGQTATYTITIQDKRKPCYAADEAVQSDTSDSATGDSQTSIGRIPHSTCGIVYYTLAIDDIEHDYDIRSNVRPLAEGSTDAISPGPIKIPLNAGMAITYELLVFTQKGEEATDEFEISVHTNEGARTRNTATLRIVSDDTAIVPPVTPPSFPEGKEITISLAKGWNLVSLPSTLVKFISSSDNQKLIAFVWIAEKNEYMSLQNARDYLGNRFASYLSEQAFWIYSYSDSELAVSVSGNEPRIQVLPGWNLLPIHTGFYGWTLDDLASSCQLQSAYGWNANKQSWDNIGTSYQIMKKDLGTGLVIKSQNACTLVTGVHIDPVLPPDYPQDCSGIGEFCGGIAGTHCCSGLLCRLDADYPDAGGSCVKLTKDCSDSDGGINYNVKGTCKDERGRSYSDYCDEEAGGWKVGGLEEVSCKYVPIGGGSEDIQGKTVCVYSGYTCPNGCKNGACVSDTKCTGEGVSKLPYFPPCCDGLTLIKNKLQADPNDNRKIYPSDGICTAKCGNGICDTATESDYNCPKDCSQTTATPLRMKSVTSISIDKKYPFINGYVTVERGMAEAGWYGDRIGQLNLQTGEALTRGNGHYPGPTYDFSRDDPYFQQKYYSTYGKEPDHIVISIYTGKNPKTFSFDAFTLYLDKTPVYIPAYKGDQNGYWLYFYVASDGSTYYANSNHKQGYPDMSYKQALTSKHLARKAGNPDDVVSSCTDSDGKDYKTFGYVSIFENGLGQSLPDSCENSGQVVEMTCLNGKAQKVWYPCQNYGSNYVCEQGRCVASGAGANTCSDTDGLDYTTLGTVSGTSGSSNYIYTDNCLDNDRLAEYTCLGVAPHANYKSCSSLGKVCQAGACITPGNQDTCTDSDGGRNYDIRGTVTDTKFGTQIKDFCTSSGQLVEQYCSDGKIASETVTCQGTCLNGACIQNQEPADDLGVYMGTATCPDGSEGKLYQRSSQRYKNGFDYWSSLKLDDVHPEIGMYRIQWYNGKWSPWYYPEKWDIDWKTNGDGSQRRAWSYFDDHTHQYLLCPDRIPSIHDGGIKTTSCTDTDGAYVGEIQGTVKYTGTNPLTGNTYESGTLTDYCVDTKTVGEYYCNTGTTQAAYSTITCEGDSICQNGMCVAPTYGGSPLLFKEQNNQQGGG